MPWRIVNLKSNDGKYLLPNHNYVVGRLEGDIIANDKSVSRKHAQLTYDSNDRNICIEDLSKFGTSINSTRIDKKNIIKNGDRITFGAQPGLDFQLTYIEFNVLASTLMRSEKLHLEEYVRVIGGRLLNDWCDSIQYLVMSKLKVTYKVICALINQISIVTAQFIKEKMEYFQGERSSEPQPDCFLPPTTDENIVNKNISFTANIARKTLFQHKTFLFLTAEKLSHLEVAIRDAGGNTVLLTEADIDQLRASDSIVMYEHQESPLVTAVYTILKKVRRRPVLDAEIGFAVLHASTEGFCNPCRPCPDSVSAGLQSTMAISVNPFQFDDNLPQTTNENRVAKKRSRNEKENSLPTMENNSKMRKEASPKNDKILSKTLSSTANTSRKMMKYNHVEEPSSTKKTDYLETVLQTNNKVFAGKSTDNRPKIGFNSERSIGFDDFGDDFDAIVVPDLGSGARVDHEVDVIAQRQPPGRVSAPGMGIAGQGGPVTEQPLEPITVARRPQEVPVQLLATTTVARTTACGLDEAAPTGQMWRFSNLVVGGHGDGPRVLGNQKAFKRVSPAYFHGEAVVMEIFNRSSCPQDV